jgi:hypothetical protein
MPALPDCDLCRMLPTEPLRLTSGHRIHSHECIDLESHAKIGEVPQERSATHLQYVNDRSSRRAYPFVLPMHPTREDPANKCGATCKQ